MNNQTIEKPKLLTHSADVHRFLHHDHTMVTKGIKSIDREMTRRYGLNVYKYHSWVECSCGASIDVSFGNSLN